MAVLVTTFNFGPSAFNKFGFGFGFFTSGRKVTGTFSGWLKLIIILIRTRNNL